MADQTRIQNSMQSRLGAPLMVAIFCRFLLKTGRRMVYPFAGLVSSALGVSLAAITLLLALNQVAAIFAPLFGHLSDRWGYRTMIALGFVLASISMLMVGLVPHYTVLMVSLLAIGIGSSICDPALHAYIGMHVPFARRGHAIGLLEVAWAASSLVGIPVAGWLVHNYSWNTPFMVMGILGLGGTTLLRRLLPSDERSHSPVLPQMKPAHLALLRRPVARAMLFYALMVSCASDIFYVTYALWIADSFRMGVMALGLATIAIGMAELGGELLTAALADRLGLRRTMLATLLVTAGCYALLPLWGFAPMGALAGIFLLCLAAEFNLVAAMSLCTETLPTARATMLSWFQAISGIGHVVGVVAGGLIWLAGGMAGVALVCATLCLFSFLAVRWGLSQWHPLDTKSGTKSGTNKVYSESDHRSHNEQRAGDQSLVLLPVWYHRVWN